jgi:hypothetical protein
MQLLSQQPSYKLPSRFEKRRASDAGFGMNLINLEDQSLKIKLSGWGRDRTVDLTIFSRGWALSCLF